MNKEELFAIWADERSPWSRWAKPVLFAHADIFAGDEETSRAGAAAVPPPYPQAQKDTALVLDLPGAEGAAAGGALAALGYRPVPLYNAIPLPADSPSTYGDGKSVAAVNVLPIITALKTSAPEIAAANLPADAPPAFLLDAGRMAAGRRMKAGEFDNRSICFTTDFPSANFMSARGIEHVLLIQKDALEPQTDLAHVLRRWQEGGLKLERMQLDPEAPGGPFEIGRPRWYAAMFQRAFAAIGLHRAREGGFGGWMPDSSGGG